MQNGVGHQDGQEEGAEIRVAGVVRVDAVGEDGVVEDVGQEEEDEPTCNQQSGERPRKSERSYSS